MATVALAAPAQAAKEFAGFTLPDWADPWLEKGTAFYERFVVDHVELGLRSSYFRLTEPTRRIYDQNGTFIGGFTEGISIDELQERQSLWPIPYLHINLDRYFGAEFGWEHFRARTSTYGVPPWESHTDGDLVAGGPLFGLRGCYANRTRFAPFVMAGCALLKTDFEEDEWWYAGGLHSIDVKNTVGVVVAGGCAARLIQNLWVELAVRRMWADIEAHYYISMSRDGRNRTNETDWTFPFGNWSGQLGLKYDF
jgi:hypothetical protein